MSDELEIFMKSRRAEGVKQAKRLRKQAVKGGLKFEAYLPPGLAEWLLDLIQKGVFEDPSEAAFVLLGEAKNLAPHADLRKELLRRTIQASMDDTSPPFRRMNWQKTSNNGHHKQKRNPQYGKIKILKQKMID